MPSRYIREGILTSLKIDKLSTEAEVFYRRLLNVVDDYGRYEVIIRLLNTSCFPVKNAVEDEDVKKWFFECVKHKLITHYKIEGKLYLQVLNFKQQTRSPAKYPNKEGNYEAKGGKK